MTDVVLNGAELLHASYVGTARHLSSVRAGRKDAYGFDGESGLTRHIEGAAGEIAAAKALNIYYEPTINAFHQPDVGGFHVRTRSRDDYDLIVRPDDVGMFILVIGTAPVFRVVGLISADEAKRPEWVKEYGGRPPAYFVPQSALEPLPEAA